MALTDIKVKKAKAKEKRYRIADGDGLYLDVRTSGKKGWLFRYQLNGKRSAISLGEYPAVSLQKARIARNKQRELISMGIDPVAEKKASKAKESAQAETFEFVAREWMEKHTADKAPGHTQTIVSRLENNVFPFIGKRPVSELDAGDMLAVVRRIERRGAIEVARRTRGICSQVFRYAISTGRALRDPAADVRGVLPSIKTKHHASITDPTGIGELLNAIDAFTGTFVVKAALRFAPLVFVRPGELRYAEWEEINIESKEWRIPAEKMKKRRPHIVPLSHQAVEVLREAREVTRVSKYVFPSIRTNDRPMSENTVNVALRRLGYSKDEMTCHGFRSMASTRLHEMGMWNSDAIERQLAHVEGNSVRAAYNYAEHLPERVKMMQFWADYLDNLRAGKKELPGVEQ